MDDSKSSFAGISFPSTLLSGSLPTGGDMSTEDDSGTAFLCFPLFLLTNSTPPTSNNTPIPAIIHNQRISREDLAYGMHALNHTGSSQEAILQYSLFVREYKQMMNEEYSTSYAELMSKNPPFHR